MPEALESYVLWQRSVRFAGEVYRATSAFPDRERFGITSQLQRPAVSIASNIAEGYGRIGQRDFLRFLGFARGSAYESFTQLTIAKEAGIPVSDTLFADFDEVLKILNGTISKLSVGIVREEAPDYGLELEEV